MLHSASGIAVLMYHGVGAPTARGEEYYTVGEDAFRAQVTLLRERTVVSYEELLAGRAPPRAVVLTFDDGERSVLTHALPVMRDHGLTATLFVTSGWIGTAGYLAAEEIRELRDAGWTIGAHTVTHRFLSDLPDTELRDELARSRDELGEILGGPPRHMSLPGGRESPRVLAAVRAAGYSSLCTSRLGLSPQRPDPFGVPRMMVVRPWGLDRFRRIVDGDRALVLSLRVRHQLLGVAKRLLGNERYVALRLRVFETATRIRRRYYY
jgi:peptidoglycan/xylan/chitin deacetylase (PgdA/CDA1 family)